MRSARSRTSHSRPAPAWASTSSPASCGPPASLVEQADALAEATDDRVVPPYGALALAAFRGREDEVTRLAQSSTQGFLARGEGVGLPVSQWVTAALYHGLARYAPSKHRPRAPTRESGRST